VSEVEEGVARLESTLAGTRVNAERALRELYDALSRDLRRAERRADRAERKLEEVRGRLRRVRRRAQRAERRLAAAPATTPRSTTRRALGRLARVARRP
jgi:chromosome segregation ATPase